MKENNFSATKQNRIFSKQESESEIRYLWRIGKLKMMEDIDLSWIELANIFNKELGKECDESMFRKKIQNWFSFFQEVNLSDNESYKKEVDKVKRELYMTKITARDEKREYRKLLREEGRFKDLYEYLNTYVKEVDYPTYEDKIYKDNNDALIVNLGDIHYGSDFETHNGKFNHHMVIEMMGTYCNKIIADIKTKGIRKVYINGLGDEIENSLHNLSAVENNRSVMEQILEVSDLIVQFISKISEHVNKVEVFIIRGNHSRLEKDYRKDLPYETLSLITEKMIDMQFKYSNKIVLHKSTKQDICIKKYKVNGLNVVIRHGDNLPKNPDKAIEKVNNMYREHIDILIFAHFHTVKSSTYNDTFSVINGAFKTSSPYAESKGWHGTPQQTAIYIKSNGDKELLIYDLIDKNKKED